MAQTTPVAHFDERQLKAFQRVLRTFARSSPAAVVRTLNRGLTAARAEGSSAAAAALGIPVRKVKRRIWMQKATRKNLSATLTASTRRVTVTTGRATKSGVSIGRGSSRQRFSRAWKHGNVWLQRLAGDAPQDPSRRWVTERGRRSSRTLRYPIQVLTTASIAEAWTPKIDAIESRALKIMRTTLDHELTRIGR